MKKPRSTMTKPPRYIWADYDPEVRPAYRWVFYTFKADQRASRPDLKPIRMKVSRA